MNALKSLLVVFLLSFSLSDSFSQSDSGLVKEKVLVFADSLLKAYDTNSWDVYVSLSHPSAIKYFGGHKNYRSYQEQMKAINKDSADAVRLSTRLVQMEKVQPDHWQCVVEKRKYQKVDGRKATIFSYMIGQSKDAGKTWAFFEIGYHDAAQLNQILPDKFISLAIPQEMMVFDSGSKRDYAIKLR